MGRGGWTISDRGGEGEINVIGDRSGLNVIVARRVDLLSHTLVCPRTLLSYTSMEKCCGTPQVMGY